MGGTRFPSPEPTKNNRNMARCRRCKHDLYAQRDGFVYCSRPRCLFAKTPHPTTSELNA